MTTGFVGIDFSDIAYDRAVAWIVAAADEPRFSSVVTPNVDHVVRMDRLGDAALGQAYRAALTDADLCLCDSRILARLARMRGIRLPVVPGSDLTAAILTDHIKPGDRVAIVGGDANTVPELRERYGDVVFSQHIPPMGMARDADAMDAAARFIGDADCRYLFIAVGSPQGEILAHRARQLGAQRGVALSIGASIDFLIGRQVRAPRVLQKLGFEWAFRLFSDPKRLWRRYLIEGPRIFAIAMRPTNR